MPHAVMRRPLSMASAEKDPNAPLCDLDGEPDDGGEGNCPPTCLDHDAAEIVIDDNDSYLDDRLADGADDEEVLRFGIIQRPTGAGCDPDADSAHGFERTYAWQFRYEMETVKWWWQRFIGDYIAK